MNSDIIYLDYAATTPVDPKVAQWMAGFLTLDGIFANPASRSHRLGWQAESAVEKARKQVAQLLNADTREIVWTSGATESNNLAIKGAAQARAGLGRHLVTSAVEHKSVLDSFAWLESQGFEVSYIQPNRHGVITPAALQQVLRPDTTLVSLMAVNNETGALNDLQALSAVAQVHGALMHVDAAQAAGKIALDLQQLPVDLLSVCAHKIYGPKGIGALFVRRQGAWVLPAQIHGGGHERGMRSGTLPTHQIAGMGLAFELAGASMLQEQQRIGDLAERFLAAVLKLPGVALNGDLEAKVPGIINLRFETVDAQMLMSALPQLAVSSGSACASASMAPSYVLQAMGLTQVQALNSLRFSLGRFSTVDEVERAVHLLKQALTKLVA